MAGRGQGICNSTSHVWSRIEQRSPEECWLWQGASVSTNGYPIIGFRGTNRKAATLAFEDFYQMSVPPGKVLMHSCHNKLCCNPHHLSVGTYKENNTQAGMLRRLRNARS